MELVMGIPLQQTGDQTRLGCNIAEPQRQSKVGFHVCVFQVSITGK